MIVQMAVADENFIDMKENINLSNENFKNCLLKLFNFENIDIQEFDGNSFSMIAKDDPTNSIFIYENQQGSFLYKITSAVPTTHKNNFIWLCNCFQMENFENIDDVLTNSTLAVLTKSTNYSTYNHLLGLKNEEVVDIKSNFKPTNVLSIDLRLKFGCLKIKCFVDPTNRGLISHAEDGSFNFYFPLVFADKTGTGIETNFESVSTIICKSNDTQNRVSIQDIISKYSPNIKSIEFLPFIPDGIGLSTGNFANVDYLSAVEKNVCKFDLPDGSMIFTDCGVFAPYGSQRGYTQWFAFGEQLPKQLCLGGGARGILRTPVANIQLDFANTKSFDPEEEFVLPSASNLCYFCMKDEGFLIDGKFKCDVPPMYLNFYTDNAGQFFIQNMTTNAQELKQIEINSNRKFDDMQNEMVYKSIIDPINQMKSGNIAGGLIGIVGSILGGQAVNKGVNIEYNYKKDVIQKEYERSLEDFASKQRTESLLAGMTGKQIGGSVSIGDFLNKLRHNGFKLIIEMNFSLLRDNQNNYYFLTQKDYDYSTSIFPNNYTFLDPSENGFPFMRKSTNTAKDLIKSIFGIEHNQNANFEFLDKIGTNYNISFYLKNAKYDQTDSLNLKSSKLLSFDIRKNKKYYQYN